MAVTAIRKASMAGVKFSSLCFLVLILTLMGLLANDLLGQTEPVRAAQAEQPAGSKLRLGIGNVKVLPGLEQQLVDAGQQAMIRRAAESIEAQLMNALQNTRKFELIARSDLEELLREQDMKPGVIIDSADTKAAVPAKVKGLQYLILTTIDDFSDTEQSTFSQDMGLAVSRRTLRMSAIVRIYDTTTGELMESMSVPVQLQATGSARAAVGDQAKNAKAVDDGIYVELSNQLASRVSQRVSDSLFPAKVIAVNGDTVTINRGAGTAINANELWEVFAVGAELKDPDTGEILGRDETKVGEVVITDVLPRFSKGHRYGEDQGIAIGQIVRPKAQQQAFQADDATRPAGQ